MAPVWLPATCFPTNLERLGDVGLVFPGDVEPPGTLTPLT